MTDKHQRQMERDQIIEVVLLVLMVIGATIQLGGMVTGWLGPGEIFLPGGVPFGLYLFYFVIWNPGVGDPSER